MHATVVQQSAGVYGGVVPQSAGVYGGVVQQSAGVYGGVVQQLTMMMSASLGESIVHTLSYPNLNSSGINISLIIS